MSNRSFRAPRAASPRRGFALASAKPLLALTFFVAAGCHAPARPHGDGGSGAKATPTPGLLAAVKPPAAIPPAAALPPVDAPALYVRYCKLCHGEKGEGYAADNAPSLISKTFLETVSPQFLRLAIERGRPGTAMAAYGKALGGPMAPYEVQALVSWLLRSAPPHVEPAPPSPGASAAFGKRLFGEQCEKCHGTPEQRREAVHLANAELLDAASDAYLRYAISYGRPGTKMVGWAETLTPRNIDELVAYLRSLARPTVQPAVPALPKAPAFSGPVVLNPRGGTPALTLRDNRFASLDSVKAALDKKQRIVILDARAPSEWERLHITGAQPLPYYDMANIDKLPNDGTWIIAYCACPHHASGVVVDELRKRGFKNTAVLDEGVFAWQNKGYPVVAAPGSLPVPAPPPLVVPPSPTGPKQPLPPGAGPGLPPHAQPTPQLVPIVPVAPAVTARPSVTARPAEPTGRPGPAK
jgi:cytochrome c oxidase cbb3-type subunit 3/ubiquinol-cytochrome c reductase cytochrome c subunit